MPVDIACVSLEHHENGFGIGHATPRISWRFEETEERDWKQTAYRLSIERDGRSREFEVASSQNSLIPWPDSPLVSSELATVTVQVKGGQDRWTATKSQTLEAGLLRRSDWKAKLIGGPEQPKGSPKTPIVLRKAFRIETLGTARLYCTAHGLYEACINGRRVGDHLLAPGWTSYHHHLRAQVYNISDLLKVGENVITAYIGEGWFAGRLMRPGWRNLYGDRLGFMSQLHLDGSSILFTDETWEWLEGPVIHGEIYDGEAYDSRRNILDWQSNNPAQGRVSILPDPKGNIVFADAPPVRQHQELKAVDVLHTKSGKTVLDFGQNITGWIRIDTDLQGDGIASLRFAEVMENGELGVRPLRTAKCTDTIILGGPTKGWEPKFTFHGFRYFEITGVEVDPAHYTAIAIASTMRRTGEFECSHQLINQLHKNTVWSTLDNFVSVPTDCPQRDERMGWTGDIQVFAPTANYMFDTSSFLSDWMQDTTAETLEFGGVCPEFVPWVGHPRATPDCRTVRAQGIWGDAVCLTPWELYITFGDIEVLRDNYTGMTAWIDHGIPRGPDGFWDITKPQYGDWLDPRAPPAFPAQGMTDAHMAANACLVHSTRILAQIAKILGHHEDADKYHADYETLRVNFYEQYITKAGRMVSDTQTAFAQALTYDLFPDNLSRQRAVERLDYLVRFDTFRISTGFAGTPLILDALANNGVLGHAYRMLQEGECPSWLYPVRMGATTIWERWDSMLEDGSINPGQMTSFNHYALGAVCDFLHRIVGGLRSAACPEKTGWKRAIVEPRPGGTIKNARTSFLSPVGLYAVDWQIEGHMLHVKVTVPPNGEAEVILPGLRKVIGSGKREFSVNWEPDTSWPPVGLKSVTQKMIKKDEYVP